MATSGLPFPTSNNAPLPIPGGYGNPSGVNFNIPNPRDTGGATPFPSMPAFGGPSYNVGSFGTGQGIAGLSSGFSTNDPHRTSQLYNMLGGAYGQGPGQLLGNLITQGLFNPQIAAAFLNAQAPGIARGEAGIQSAFSDAGARFSSASALGLGDFESQVQLNQQQVLAQLFENAQSEQLSLLQSVLPTIHQERANQGGGILHDILGGLEIVGGAVAAPFSGGASLGLLGAGLSTLAGGGGGGGGGASPGGGGGLAGLLSSLGNPSGPGLNPNLLSASVPASSTPVSTNDLLMQLLQSSAASNVGGQPWQGTPFPLPQ